MSCVVLRTARRPHLRHFRFPTRPPERRATSRSRLARGAARCHGSQRHQREASGRRRDVASIRASDAEAVAQAQLHSKRAPELLRQQPDCLAVACVAALSSATGWWLLLPTDEGGRAVGGRRDHARHRVRVARVSGAVPSTPHAAAAPPAARHRRSRGTSGHRRSPSPRRAWSAMSSSRLCPLPVVRLDRLARGGRSGAGIGSPSCASGSTGVRVHRQPPQRACYSALDSDTSSGVPSAGMTAVRASPCPAASPSLSRRSSPLSRDSSSGQNIARASGHAASAVLAASRSLQRAAVELREDG